MLTGCHSLRLKQFQKFESATTALGEVSSLVEGKVSPLLASLLETVKDEKKVSLAVADPKLGAALFSAELLYYRPATDDMFQATLLTSFPHSISSQSRILRRPICTAPFAAISPPSFRASCRKSSLQCL